MTVTIPRPENRSEWLASRHGYFNASQAGALYDCHPHITLADVVAEKLAPHPPDDAPTEAMERGNRLEPVLLEWFGEQNNVTVTTPDVMFANGRVLANLDGEIVGAPHAWIEAKTTAQYWDKVPDHVRWQVVAQGYASGRYRCYVVWLDASMRLKTAEVEPTADELADFAERVEQFMACIDLGLAPEGVLLSWEHLKALHPTADPELVVDLDDAGLLTLVEWEQTRLARLEFRKDEDALKARVAELLGDAAEARYNGVPVASWRNTKDSPRMDWRAAALTLAEELGVSEHELIEAHTYPRPGNRVLRSTRHLLRQG